MREILKIEKVNTVKALTASLIDLVITIVVGIALFYLAYLPIFKASTTYNESQNYIYSVEKVENSDTKLGYDLTLGDNLGYEKYVLEAKKFYEFYEDELVTYYFEAAQKDESVKPEYKERFKSIELIYNFTFLGLDYKAIPTEENSYSNKYFIYKFDENTHEILWSEYAIDNPRTLDFNERGIAEREDYVYTAFSNLKNLLMKVDSTYVKSLNEISLFNSVSSMLSAFTTILIFYIILPLCFKNNATLAKKIFGYGYVNRDGTKLPWYKGLCKALIALVLPVLGMYFTSIYALIILVIFPYFINIMYFLLTAKDQDILDKIFRMKIVDIKNSLMFDNAEAEEEYFKSESYEQNSEEEADYTNMLSNVKTLDLKSIEEKIEDEQRANEKSK